MNDFDELLREAAEIRKRYQETEDPEERKRLQDRYKQIATQIQSKRTPTKPKKQERRVSLGRPDELDEDASNLLELCEVVAQDGILTDSEIDTLRSWLSRRPRGEVPAIDFLSDAVALISTGERITPIQRKELYKAIETVLPVDRRKFATQRRKMAEALEKEREKEEKAAERQRQKEEKALNRPIYYADFMIAGVSYEGRSATIETYVKGGDSVYLIRDRRNKYSRNAIEIRTIHGYHIGYVPEEDAGDLAPYFDKGCPHVAHVKKFLNREYGKVPVVVAQIFDPQAQVPALIFEKNVPTKKARPGCGCASAAFAILLVWLAVLSVIT